MTSFTLTCVLKALSPHAATEGLGRQRLWGQSCVCRSADCKEQRARRSPGEGGRGHDIGSGCGDKVDGEEKGSRRKLHGPVGPEHSVPGENINSTPR